MKAWIVIVAGQCQDPNCGYSAEGSYFVLAEDSPRATCDGLWHYNADTSKMQEAQGKNHNILITKIRANALASDVVIAAGQQLSESV